MTTQPSHHLLTYYDSMTLVYNHAADLGFPYSHIAEFYLDRWWTQFEMWHIVPVEECVASA